MSTGEAGGVPREPAGIGIVRRDGRTDPFFDGAAEDRLMISRCEPCDLWYPPDAAGCPECGTEDLTWAAASGDAVLVSWVVAHSRGAEPAPLALVELAEGPWMYGRLHEVAEPRLDLPLRAHFVHPDEGESYPVFKERR